MLIPSDNSTSIRKLSLGKTLHGLHRALAKTGRTAEQGREAYIVRLSGYPLVGIPLVRVLAVLRNKSHGQDPCNRHSSLINADGQNTPRSSSLEWNYSGCLNVSTNDVSVLSSRPKPLLLSHSYGSPTLLYISRNAFCKPPVCYGPAGTFLLSVVEQPQGYLLVYDLPYEPFSGFPRASCVLVLPVICGD